VHGETAYETLGGARRTGVDSSLGGASTYDSLGEARTTTEVKR
jgi:hypothetical protein